MNIKRRRLLTTTLEELQYRDLVLGGSIYAYTHFTEFRSIFEHEQTNETIILSPVVQVDVVGYSVKLELIKLCTAIQRYVYMSKYASCNSCA